MSGRAMQGQPAVDSLALAALPSAGLAASNASWSEATAKCWQVMGLCCPTCLSREIATASLGRSMSGMWQLRWRLSDPLRHTLHG